MIHENNLTLADEIPDEKITEFEARYDAIVRTATKEYEENSPSDYYQDGYTLYLYLRLMFRSNPLVEPDYNLCERKARVLRGKCNQVILLRSFEHLTYFCKCLSVLDHLATDRADNFHQTVKEIFKRQKPVNSKIKKSKTYSIGISEQ